MGGIHRCIEGALTGVAYADLTALGAKTITHLIVPDGMTCLDELRITMSQLIQTDQKGGLLAVRLSGGALVHSPYEFFVCGFTNGTAVTSGGHVQHMEPFVKKCGLIVRPGQPLVVEGCVASGSDPGTTEVAIEAKWAASGGTKKYSFARYGSEAALDTETAMDLTAESVAATDILFPSDVSECIGVVMAVGGICLATATGGGSHYRFKSGFSKGPFVLGGPAWSSLATNPGICSGIIESVDIPMHKAISKNALCEITAEQNGVDWGTVYLGVSVEVQ